MPYVYFAKININSKIFDVYKERVSADDILKELFDNIDQEKRLKVDEKDNIWVKFINIEKDYDKNFIAGRVLQIFEDDIEIYDEKCDDTTPLPSKNLARTITFFFDLRYEIIAFTTSQRFSKKKVVEYFQKLINSYSKITFEVFLLQDRDLIYNKIKAFKKISKINIVLIPPNSNKDEFIELFPKNYEEISEIGATKIEQNFLATRTPDGVNIKSGFFNRVISAISKGFGSIKISGQNKENENLEITSQENAPYRKSIPKNQRNSISAIKERGRSGIVEFLAKVSNIDKKE